MQHCRVDCPKSVRLAAALVLLLICAGAARAADSSAPPGGTIAYALTNINWALQQSPEGKTECPNGFNDGNREQFKKLFPADGTRRTLVDTQLRREIEAWYPTTAPDLFEFQEARGELAPGFDLDGNNGPEDFAGPEGEAGIDNQMFRALGCIENYRGPDGAIRFFEDEMILRENYNRILVELSGVDSLVDDEDVQVAIYRGRDPLLLDASGLRAVPGGTQRIDLRWGARYIRQMRGRIRDGVLLTDAVDLLYPWDVFYMPTDQYMYSARLRLKLTPTGAVGLLGGYTDVETWYLHMIKSWSTHHQSYGKTSAPSLYKALRRLADARPDPETGANRAISSALDVYFTQVLILPESRAELATLAPPRTMAPYRGVPYPRPAAEETGAGAENIAAAQAHSTPRDSNRR